MSTCVQLLNDIVVLRSTVCYSTLNTARFINHVMPGQPCLQLTLVDLVCTMEDGLAVYILCSCVVDLWLGPRLVLLQRFQVRNKLIWNLLLNQVCVLIYVMYKSIYVCLGGSVL